MSRQLVYEWRSGVKVPGPATRAALWSAYGIPNYAWGRMPSGGGELADDDPPPPLPVPVPSARAADTDTAPNSITDTDKLIAKLRTTAAADNLLPGDQIRLADSEAKLLALRHRMQRDQELLEDKIVRDHPAWQRIRRTLAEVLSKHPQAAADVAEALQRLDMGTL